MFAGLHVDHAVPGTVAAAIDAEDAHETESIPQWAGLVIVMWVLLGKALKRGAGGGVELPGHSPGEERLPACEHRMLHRLGHEYGLGCMGNRGVDQYRIRAHVHG